MEIIAPNDTMSIAMTAQSPSNASSNPQLATMQAEKSIYKERPPPRLYMAPTSSPPCPASKELCNGPATLSGYNPPVQR